MVRDWPLAIALAERLQRDCGERRGARDRAFPLRARRRRRWRRRAPRRFEGARRELDGRAAGRSGASAAAAAARRSWRCAEGDPRRRSRPGAAARATIRRYLALVAPGWLAAHAADRAARRRASTRSRRVHREHPSVGRVRGDRAPAARAARRQRGGGRVGRRALQAAAVAARSRAAARPAGGCCPGDGDRAEIELTQRLIQPQARRLSRYVCGHCGFKARQFYWQCPGCSRWDTYRAEAQRGTRAGESNVHPTGHPDRFLRGPASSWSAT